jgi:hypothetical protein
MSSPPSTDPKPTTLPRTPPRYAYPDMGTLVADMDRARAEGDEALRAALNPRYELAHAHGDGWGAHIPLLASVVATARPGPVLEIGVGRSSSPLLVEMCRAMGRDYRGLDSEPDWAEEIRGVLGVDTISVMPDWSRLESWLKDSGEQWAVVFIDHGPGPARLPVTRVVREHAGAEFIVCHDTFNPWLEGLHEYLDTFKFRSDYVIMPSSTSVVSDVRAYAGAR